MYHETWTADADRRTTARIPASLRFQEKWRLALTLLRQVRAAKLHVTAVVADAAYGDNSTLRQALHRAKLPYALGISPTLTVFLGTSALRVDRAQPTPRNRHEGWPVHEASVCACWPDCSPRRSGDGCRGRTDRIRRELSISPPSVSRRPATGGIGDLRPKSGSCARAASATRHGPSTT
jgi:hypothetical protein